MIYVMICGLKTASMPPMDEIPGMLLPFAKRNNHLFHNIENKSVKVKSVANKQGILVYQANRIVLTCTV